mmetsp:Transcript_45927/g.112039  ORF Transcript_45927/g.112039 Transcript_45927/m.112039 type:complete len:646 (+) Transcript_45927:363-2300(+)
MTDVSTPCQTELMDVNICVGSNTAMCAPCLDYPNDKFEDEFPNDAEDGFRKAVAFIPPTQKGFCDEANYRVCENQEQNMYCCCQEEIDAYMKCNFNSVWVAKFGVVEQCEYFGCEDAGAVGDGGDGGGTDMSIIYIIIGACAAILVLLSTFLYWRYQKLKAAKAVALAKKRKLAAKSAHQKNGKKALTNKKSNGKTKAKGKRDIEQGYSSDDDDGSSDDENDRKSRKSSKSKKKNKAKTTRKTSESDDDDTESTSEHGKSNRSKNHHHHRSRSRSRSAGSRNKSFRSKRSKKSREEELEKERLQAERAAKLARLEKRISTRKLEVAKNQAKAIEAELGAELVQTEAEKREMEQHMAQLEQERMLMEQRIVDLENGNGGIMMMTDGYAGQDPGYLMAVGEGNMMSQPYGIQPGMVIAPQPQMVGYYENGMSMDDGSTIPSQATYPNVINIMPGDDETFDDVIQLQDSSPELDVDGTASWLAQNISRRVDNADSMNTSRNSSQSRHKSRSRSRSHSKERLDKPSRRPRSLEKLSTHDHDPKGLSRSEHHHHHHPRKPRSSENLSSSVHVPSRGVSRSTSERHSHNKRYSGAHMVDHTGNISGTDRISTSGRSKRSRSKESIDKSNRSAPSRSKSDDLAYMARSTTQY